LDAVTQVLQRLQVDNFQLVSKVNKLEQEIETRTDANKTLNLQLQSLEHERSRFISEHEESHLQLQLLEEEMASLIKSSSLVQDLGEEISILKSNIFRLVEEGHRLSDGRALHEQMLDVSHERDQLLSENITVREQHLQEPEINKEHLDCRLVQSEED
jgi:predicted  nucleic acid-binding Zn-ribbon protein